VHTLPASLIKLPFFFNCCLRVKYLDEEDLTKEGWVKVNPKSDFLLFRMGDYRLNLLDESIVMIGNPNAISITGKIKYHHKFKGTIKNISEFRRLMKQLNIA